MRRAWLVGLDAVLGLLVRVVVWEGLEQWWVGEVVERIVPVAVPRLGLS